MNWSLRTILLLVATVALSLYLIRANHGNYKFMLGIYLALTAVAIVGAIPAKALLRPGFMGASIFGVSYFVFVLQAGYGVETLREAQGLRANALLGFSLLGLSLMASQLCALFVWPRKNVNKLDEPPA